MRAWVASIIPMKDRHLAGDLLPLLEPGDRHPWGPLAPVAAAEVLRVPESTLISWCGAGLPRRADGRFDVLDLINWVTWNRLSDCPVLARRWRTFATWFAGVEGMKRRTLRWRRHHRLFLPAPVDHLSWWIPAPASLPGQRIERESRLDARGCTAARSGAYWRLEGAPLDTTVEAVGETVLALMPTVLLPPDAGEHRLLAGLVEAVAEDFRYEYRFHAAYEAPVGQPVPSRWTGSCLDAALTLGALCDRIGRRWRLMGGIVAHTAIANPHFWVECFGEAGLWIPVDPTIPAVWRMLGRDWRAIIPRVVGVRDSSRIILICGGEGIAGIPGGPTCRSIVGEALATVAGVVHNAIPCLDWACADCQAEFGREGPPAGTRSA